MCRLITAQGSLHVILEKSGWECDKKGITQVYMCSSGDILWNLVSSLRCFSLISQLKSLVRVKDKAPVLGYLAIDPVPLLNSLFQNKGVRETIIRLTAGLPGVSHALSFGHSMACEDAESSGQGKHFFSLLSVVLLSVYICLSFLPFLPLSLFLFYPTHFPVNKIWQHIFLPWITPQTIKKMHFSMMECHSKINYSTN